MVYRTRIKYTAAQRADIWDRWQRGESLNSIGRLFDRPSSSVFNMLAPTGGIRPPSQRRSRLALVAAWAESRYTKLQEEIRKEREWEDQQDRGRNESFE